MTEKLRQAVHSAGIYAQDVKRIEKEIKEYGRSGRIKSVQRSTYFIDTLNQPGGPDSDGGSNFDGDIIGHGAKNNQIQQLGKVETNRGERTGRDGVSDSRSGGNDRQGQDVDERFSYAPKDEFNDELLRRYDNSITIQNEYNMDADQEFIDILEGVLRSDKRGKGSIASIGEWINAVRNGQGGFIVDYGNGLQNPARGKNFNNMDVGTSEGDTGRHIERGVENDQQKGKASQDFCFRP